METIHDYHEILIERFLTTWWVRSILHNENNEEEIIQQPAGLAEIEEVNKSLKNGNILPVKIFLFLKWLIEELSHCDQNKMVRLFSNNKAFV